MWTRPTAVEHDDEKWKVTVRAPKAVADFTDVPMSVRVRNNQTAPASAQISATLECRDRDNVCKENIAYARALVRGSTQSGVFLENIPANGEVITWFDLRAVIQAKGEATPNSDINLETNVQINQESVFSPNEAFLSGFDRDKVFRLWAIQNLLSPPGSNIVVPIFFLFIVVLAEIVTDMVVMLRSSDDRGERVRWIAALLLVLLLVSVFLLLTRPLVDLGPFFSDDPLNVRLRHAVFWFVMGAVGLGIVFGLFASTRKQNPSKGSC